MMTAFYTTLGKNLLNHDGNRFNESVKLDKVKQLLELRGCHKTTSKCCALFGFDAFHVVVQACDHVLLRRIRPLKLDY